MAFFECMIGGGSGDGSTLTVTCYSGFAGLTISITNGVDTFSDVCPSTSPYEVVFGGLADGTWTLSTVYNGTTYTQTVEINGVTQFYPIPDGATVTPTDDIQTWLFCDEIFDKNYTTISQVLSDTSTLLALINSNNAVDYMARSATFASDVCANSTAMGYIGNNDYCANKLLADSTWAAAICNSTYFESVLTTKIPTMTSNTAPSGMASASSYNLNKPPYYAFDGNDATFLSPADDSPQLQGGTLSNYPKYEFAAAVNIKKVVVKLSTNGGGGYGSSTYKLRIKVSTDNSSWTTVYTDATASNPTDARTINLQNNSVKGKYITFDVILTNGCWDVRAYTIQAYGRS